MNEHITLNGVEVWAFVVVQENGFRMRLSLDDWDHCRLHRGEQIALGRHEQAEQRFFLAEAVEMPPVAWFNLVSRMSPEFARPSILVNRADSAGPNGEIVPIASGC